MKLKNLKISNVRSFADIAEFKADGMISIIVGPNGGGKTNLLDAIMVVARRYLMPAWMTSQSNNSTIDPRPFLVVSDALQNLTIEKNSGLANVDQTITAVVEITEQDVKNIRDLKQNVEALFPAARKYQNGENLVKSIESWDVDSLSAGTEVSYVVHNGNRAVTSPPAVNAFIEYLSGFEWIAILREASGLQPLSTPLLYLPVNRTANGLPANVTLAGFNFNDQKKNTDLITSRSGGNMIGLAFGKIAKMRRNLELDPNKHIDSLFDEPQMAELTAMLKSIGYSWQIDCANPDNNQYDFMLTKQGRSFAVAAASSGEKELLTYLFIIFALNVRDALIVVDEPELHLHPRWQRTLLGLFEKLAKSTGNQFIVATHSSVFIAPSSIQYVSRVYSEDQKSNILRISDSGLPNSKHLFNVVNSQNNESIFFADKVILVEGISDKLVIEAIAKKLKVSNDSAAVVEVVAVGGKSFFPVYEKLLDACSVRHCTVADLDYVEQIGTPEIKKLFSANVKSIRTDVVENQKSYDGQAFFEAIEDALASGDLTKTREIWAYIKSRRISLRTDLDEAQRTQLSEFLKAKEAEAIFILPDGAIEAYLPEGLGLKDLDKLISFLSDSDFFEQLKPQAKAYLSSLAGKVFKAN